MSNVTFEIMEVGNLYFKVHQIIIAQRPKYILIFGYAIYQSIFYYNVYQIHGILWIRKINETTDSL